MTLLLPALRRAREAANATTCMSNLRQIGHALAMYVQDNQGWFPNAANNWISPSDWIYWQSGRDKSQSRLNTYLSGNNQFLERIYICPSDEVNTRSGFSAYRYSYSMNARIGGAHMSTTDYYPEFPPCKQSHIARPSEKILMIDEASTGIDDGAWAVFSMTVTDGRTHNILSNRHDKRAETITDSSLGKGTVIFADCHADFVNRSWCLMPKYCDPRAK